MELFGITVQLFNRLQLYSFTRSVYSYEKSPFRGIHSYALISSFLALTKSQTPESV